MACLLPFFPSCCSVSCKVSPREVGSSTAGQARLDTPDGEHGASPLPELVILEHQGERVGGWGLGHLTGMLGFGARRERWAAGRVMGMLGHGA